MQFFVHPEVNTIMKAHAPWRHAVHAIVSLAMEGKRSTCYWLGIGTDALVVYKWEAVFI